MTSVDDARVDRDALEALLRENGLAAHAARLAHEVAQTGLRIVGSDEGARSRLGGPALLPPGEAWPHDARGRPLTFLAGIDFSEVPPADGCEALPTAGWLLFFADITCHDEDSFLGEETRNEEGAGARVLAVAPGEEPVPAEPPAGAAVLNPRPVEFAPQLTLPDGDDSASGLGLGDDESEAYDEIAVALRLGSDEGEGEDVVIDLGEGDDDADDEEWPQEGDDAADHWILGAVTGVQGHEPLPGTVLLFYLDSDEALDFMYAGAGDIEFRIGPEALARADWSQVVALVVRSSPPVV